MALRYTTCTRWPANSTSARRPSNVQRNTASRPLRRAISGNTPLSGFPLGLLLGFLPCGLVYGPLVVAAGSGSPLLGAGIMAALGFGTMPVLFIFGSASTAVSGKMRDILFRCVGLIVALMGMTGLWRVLAKIGYLPRFPLL